MEKEETGLGKMEEDTLVVVVMPWWRKNIYGDWVEEVEGGVVHFWKGRVL